MSNIIARIGIYGDIHLSSKNYGAHRDYPKESLYYFSKITDVAREKQLTHLIGTGDFTFGRFHSLEYRLSVERNLEEQYSITNGNRYELQGNHDIATYGMCERDYYIEKGLLKPSCNMDIGNLHITMVDYGKSNSTVPNIVVDNGFNLLITHDYFKFKDTQLPNFGKCIEIDNYDKWFGADYIVCGHVHKDLEFNGSIFKNDSEHRVHVNYLGCMSRPAYREGLMDKNGKVLIVSVFDTGEIQIETELIPLWDIEESFNMNTKLDEVLKKEEKASRVDISDIVKQLDTHDRNVGSPEEIIQGLVNIEPKYKDKAIELLKLAMY